MWGWCLEKLSGGFLQEQRIRSIYIYKALRCQRVRSFIAFQVWPILFFSQTQMQKSWMAKVCSGKPRKGWIWIFGRCWLWGLTFFHQPSTTIFCFSCRRGIREKWIAHFTAFWQCSLVSLCGESASWGDHDWLIIMTWNLCCWTSIIQRFKFTQTLTPILSIWVLHRTWWWWCVLFLFFFFPSLFFFSLGSPYHKQPNKETQGPRGHPSPRSRASSPVAFVRCWATGRWATRPPGSRFRPTALRIPRIRRSWHREMSWHLGLMVDVCFFLPKKNMWA